MAVLQYYPFQPDPDEDVVLLLRMSLLVPLIQTTPLLLMCIGLLALWSLANGLGDSTLARVAEQLSLVGVAVGPLLALWGMKKVLDWIFTIYVVTTRRVVVQRGIVFQRRRESPLEKIQDAVYELRGFTGTVFKIGDIILEMAGFASNTVFRSIDHAPEVHTEILRQITTSKQQARRQRILQSGTNLLRQFGIDTDIKISPQSASSEESGPPDSELLLGEENGTPIVWRKHKFILIEGLSGPFLLGLIPFVGTTVSQLIFGSWPLEGRDLPLVVFSFLYVWLIGLHLYRLVRGQPPSPQTDEHRGSMVSSVRRIPQRVSSFFRDTILAPILLGISVVLAVTLIARGSTLSDLLPVTFATFVQRSFVLFTSVYYSSLFIWTLYISADWFNDQYILLGRRIIDIERIPPLLFERRREARLVQIQGINYQFTGLIGRILGFGNVTIETAGRTAVVFTNVPNPPQVQSIVFQRVGLVEQKEREEIQRRINEEMSGWFTAMAQLVQGRRE